MTSLGILAWMKINFKIFNNSASVREGKGWGISLKEFLQKSIHIFLNQVINM